ncbi:hypothetical protein [Streptomyces sp. NPDC050535]
MRHLDAKLGIADPTGEAPWIRVDAKRRGGHQVTAPPAIALSLEKPVQ